MKKIPLPVIQRLSYLFDVLNKMENRGIQKVSSAELGRETGQTAHTIRKDIHYLGVAGTAGTKYEIAGLKGLVSENLGYSHPKRSCIVGLGRLGGALLEHLLSVPPMAFDCVAGFDSNINRVETIRTTIELYPSYRLEEVIERLQIELAILAVPPQQAQEVADRCCDSGVKGLLNFTAAAVRPRNDAVFVRSVDIAAELRILAALAFTTMNRTE